MIDWSNIRYFKKNEAWGDPDKMDLGFIAMLDQFRHISGTPFIVTEGWGVDGHLPKSQHYQVPCRAVDGHFRNRELSPMQAYIYAEMVGFNGIGIYPNEGRWFIHLDHRGLHDGDVKKRWVRTDQGIYYPLTGETWNKYVLPVENKYQKER